MRLNTDPRYYTDPAAFKPIQKAARRSRLTKKRKKGLT